jgi:hypothetical protein
VPSLTSISQIGVLYGNPKESSQNQEGKNVSSKPQEQQKHPAEWSDELNPHRMEGQNIGASTRL